MDYTASLGLEGFGQPSLGELLWIRILILPGTKPIRFIDAERNIDRFDSRLGFSSQLDDFDYGAESLPAKPKKSPRIT